MNETSHSVKAQYEKWVYPRPIEDLSKANRGVLTDPSTQFHRYWPFGLPDDGLNKPKSILVAGCGTNQAAMVAFRNPDWTVTGIDLSTASLDHQNGLKLKHDLSNLHLENLDLTQSESLGEKFDLIISTGVLHHLPEPLEGLRALRNCLKPHGILVLMVYGKTLRHAIYPLQDAFRAIGLSQCQSDVDFVKYLLSQMPPSHGIKRYESGSDDLKYDAGIVDTFLHPIDRAYSVGEVFDFMDQGDLMFLNWLFPARYSIDMMLGGQTLAKIKQSGPYSPIEEAQIVDGILQHCGRHDFYCCLPRYERELQQMRDSRDIFDGVVSFVPQITINQTEETEYSIHFRGKPLALKIDRNIARVITESAHNQTSSRVTFRKLFNSDIDEVSKDIKNNFRDLLLQYESSGVISLHY